MTNLICIVCPKGCHLQVDEKTLAVTGNACEKGDEYAKNELTAPTRVVTSTVKIIGALHNRCPVKTDGAIPKQLVFEAVKLLDNVKLQSPVKIGTIVAKNIFDTNINIVVTRDM